MDSFHAMGKILDLFHRIFTEAFFLLLELCHVPSNNMMMMNKLENIYIHFYFVKEMKEVN